MEYKKTGIAIVFAALAGCANQQPTHVTSGEQDYMAQVRCHTDVAPEQRVNLEMVDTLTARDKPFAALARLQSETQQNQEYWQRYGQLLARTGDLESATQLFTAMEERCQSGEAYHGLGMVAMKNGNSAAALDYFEKAVNLKPASAAIRNDYGYVLLVTGDYKNAQNHLRTALELQNGNGQARQNLAMAYWASNNQQGLKLLKEQYHFTDEELSHAKQLAAQLGS